MQFYTRTYIYNYIATLRIFCYDTMRLFCECILHLIEKETNKQKIREILFSNFFRCIIHLGNKSYIFYSVVKFARAYDSEADLNFNMLNLLDRLFQIGNKLVKYVSDDRDFVTSIKSV